MNRKELMSKHVRVNGDWAHVRIDVSDSGLAVHNAMILALVMQVSMIDNNDGDLGVVWDTDNVENNTDAETMGTLLLRNVDSTDETTKIMSAFYFEKAFDAALKQLLVDLGFDTSIAEDVRGSEWGMQSPGRASYDAYKLAEYIRRVVTAH